MTMQQEAFILLNEMPDDSLRLIVEMMRQLLPSDRAATNAKKRIGVAAGEKLYADDYDFDQDNDKIAEMFGVL